MPLALAVAAALALLPQAAAPAGGTARVLPLDTGWDTSGEVRVETYLGKPAMRFRTGRAVRRDVSLEDGTIDALVAVSGRRSFAYVQFRMQGDEEHEEFYLRPHKSALPDAVQYAPVFKGESYWQFFHGPGGTASVEIPRDRWVPVRVVVSGGRAALFVDDLTTPRLVVPKLGRDAARGYLALRSFVPQGSAPDGELPVSYAEVTVRPGFVPYDFSRTPAPAVPAGTISRWSVSPSFAPAAGPIRAPRPDVLAGGGWTTLGTDATGRVLLFRDRARPKPRERAAVLARVTLTAPADGIRRLDLGYSDEVTVFLNGQPLFSGDASYHFDDPRQDGVVTLSQSTVYLPLKRGPNELLLAVSDVFGGWGFTGRLDGADGVEVSAEAPTAAPLPERGGAAAQPR